MKSLILAGMIGILATGAIAHSPLTSTTPQNETVVTEVPEEIMLNFKGKIRLTRVEMIHSETSGVNLDLSSHKGFVSEYVVPLQNMGDGHYLIEWRGLGADGHALNGSFSFTVQ